MPEAKADADKTGPAPGTQALWKALHVLELIGAATHPLRFTDLSAASGLPKGTLHRILQTLADARYIQLDERDQTYRLGSRLFEMAHRVWDAFDLRGAAEPELVRLRDLTGETVRIGVLDAGEILYIDQREIAQPVRLGFGVGSRAAAHASGMGKAILSHLPHTELERLLASADLAALTQRTVVGQDALRRELDVTKARGYAVSIEEQHVGISSVAAPIRDYKGEPIGAIGIVGPSFRLEPDTLHALGREVMEAARRIAGNIGQSAMSISVNPRPLGPDRDDVRCAISVSNFVAEGPHWSGDDAVLYWVDILAPAIYAGDPVSGEYRSYPAHELVSVVVPRRAGGLIAATQGGIRKLDLESGSTELLTHPESDLPDNRFNDGKCDALGRFWVGTLAMDTAPGKGALWRVDSDGSAHRMDEGFQVSNGLAWSPDGTILYFADSGARTVYAYDFDMASGQLGERRPFVRLAEGEGMPGGLTVDAEGHLWCTHWDGWCVTRYDPRGKAERVVNLPVPRPTSCVFGGADLRTLFVTSARLRLSVQQLADAPLSGAILAVDTGIAGIPENRFAG